MYKYFLLLLFDFKKNNERFEIFWAYIIMHLNYIFNNDINQLVFARMQMDNDNDYNQYKSFLFRK